MGNDLEAFRGVLEGAGLEEVTLKSPNVDSTIARSPHTTKSIEVLRTLPQMSLEASFGNVPDLAVKGKLGEGGMGVVLLASQRPLDRLVAVKSTHDHHSQTAIESLLQEAYITGMVEHPNVVPIYSVGKDEKGRPIIVMKRIEGTSWKDVLLNPKKGPKDTEIDLVWHLKILVEICDAIRFAHSRGIIHRDIKPENVMIGNYGEVYVLDWGIAISIREEFNPMLAHKATAPGIAGTPAFMAPELTDDTPMNVDERTDVYLLGASLHYLMTRQNRHPGENNMQAMLAARMSRPIEYGSEIPEELASVANKATAASKEDRFQSVADFREALLNYLEHRASLRLSGQALRVWQTSSEMLDGPRDEATDLLIHERLNECRFGFREALTLWPDNAEARDGLQIVLEALVNFYISIGNDIGAQAALQQFLQPRPNVVAEVQELAKRREAEREEVDRLKKFQISQDMKVGASARSITALILGAFWTWSNINAQQQLNAGLIEDPLWDHLIAAPRTIGIAALMMIIFRKRLFSNVANRRLMQVLIGGLVAITCGRLVAYHQGMDIVAAQGIEIFIWAYCATLTGIVSDDGRITAASGFMYVAGFMGVYWPQYQLYPMAGAVAIFFLVLAIVWTPRFRKRNLV